MPVRTPAHLHSIPPPSNASGDAPEMAPGDVPAHLPLLINDRDSARLIGVSRATFWRRVADGTLPGPLKIGAASRWRRDEILAAIERLSELRGR